MKAFEVSLALSSQSHSSAKLLYSKLQTGHLPDTAQLLQQVRGELLKHTSYNPLVLLQRRQYSSSDRTVLTVLATAIVASSLALFVALRRLS